MKRASKLNHEIIEQCYNNNQLKLCEKYKTLKEPLLTICRCGKQFYIDPYKVLYCGKKHCGCIPRNGPPRKVKVGDIFHLLTVIEFSHKRIYNNKQQSLYWKCKCMCGNTRIVTSGRLLHNQIRSCGCVDRRVIRGRNNRKNISGIRFGKLVAISFCEIVNRKSIWLCKCDCGRTKKVLLNSLTTGRTQTCGFCAYNFVNGKMVSRIQIRLFKLLNKGVINFKSYKYNLDIALVYNRQKIAIEYDEWYWHQYNKEKDERKYKYLLDHGWKVLRIIANNCLPTLKELIANLERLNDKNYIELRLNV